MEASDDRDENKSGSTTLADFTIPTCVDKVAIPNHENWYWLQISTITMKKGIDLQLRFFS